jgi:hypothetical protein
MFDRVEIKDYIDFYYLFDHFKDKKTNLLSDLVKFVDKKF